MSNCIFCMIADHQINSQVLYEDETCIVILDLSQTTRGHSLVISKKHASSILEADPQDVAHMFMVAQKMAVQIKANLHAAGINILTNAKEAAGQTVDHFHIHIIPRYDENDGFNPIFANNEGKEDLSAIKTEILK